MLEGNLYYHDKEDFWYMVLDNGHQLKVSELIYGLAGFYAFDADKLNGKGERIKISLEVDGALAARP